MVVMITVTIATYLPTNFNTITQVNWFLNVPFVQKTKNLVMMAHIQCFMNHNNDFADIPFL